MYTRCDAIRVAAAAALLHAAAWVQAAEYPAQLQWAQRLELSVPVSGVVETVTVQVGDRVERGDRMLALDARGFKAAVQHANADITRLRAIRDEARREQDRAEELYARTVLSDHDLQLAKNAFTSADAEYQAARAALILAELHLEVSAIVAPINGVVVQRQVEPGQTVASDLQAATLLVLAANDRMHAHARLSAEQLAGIERGATASVEVAGKTYNGKIHSLGLEPLAASGEAHYAVVVEFPVDADATLRAGQTAKLILP